MAEMIVNREESPYIEEIQRLMALCNEIEKREMLAFMRGSIFFRKVKSETDKKKNE